MANRRRFTGTTRKRKMTWEGSIIQILNLDVSPTIVNTIISEATLEQFPSPTIIRTRGRVWVGADVASGASSFATVTMGMIVVTSAALSGGAATIPGPQNLFGSDWLWWDTTITADWQSGVNEGSIWREVIIDSKAMRKIGSNEVLVFVAELTECEGVSVTNICGSVRVLLKAP